MDVRELWNDQEEMFRVAHASLMSSMFFAMPAMVTEDSADGHTVSAQPTIKRRVTDQSTGQVTFEEHPVHVDVPIHHWGGGQVTHTTPTLKGDEGHLIYVSRQMDAWHQSGGVQQPLDNALNEIGDVLFVKGLRSDPRKLQQVSSTSSQIRDDAKHHVIDHDPSSGTHIKSVDPSTAPASAGFDPFASASKFFEHFVHPTNGILANATDGGMTHAHGVAHDVGAFMAAQNAAHIVRAHPVLGALLSALSGQHLVQAHPQNGVMVASQTAVGITSAGPLSLSAPPGMLSLGGLMGGSIGSGALASGAASSNVGALGGDLAGSLPNPTVIGLSHVDAHLLPAAASDSAAASAGVSVGGLYRNTAVSSGVSVLAVRMS